MTVESELRVHRTEADLTQAELAVDVGVSRQTINAVETWKYDPSLEPALRLAERFDVAVEDLFALVDSD